MPRQFHPIKSGVHRIACIALYRALLEQCPRIPIPADIVPRGPVHPLKHFIRKRFRRNRYEDCPQHAATALKVGYTAEQLLRSAGDGNEASKSQIYRILRTLQAQSAASALQAEQHVTPRKPRVWAGPYPGAAKVLETRPLPLEKLSGRRQVPHLTAGGAFPFLRLKKPQSPYLSRVIRDKTKKRQKRSNHLDALEVNLEIAEMEELWEQQVKQQLELDGGQPDMKWTGSELGSDWGVGGWRRAAVDATDEVMAMMQEEARRAKEKGDRFTEILHKEEQLWNEERGKRRAEKQEARRSRREKEKQERIPDKIEDGNLRPQEKKEWRKSRFEEVDGRGNERF